MHCNTHTRVIVCVHHTSVDGHLGTFGPVNSAVMNSGVQILFESVCNLLVFLEGTTPP